MELAMKIEKQSTKFIKPLVTTPPTLGRYKLGLMDEFVVVVNVGVVLFFSPNNDHNLKYVANLEKSLEKTLTRLYPLAGRYDEETNSIDCNDQGVEFIKAKANIKLQDILVSQVNHVKFIDEFIPCKLGVAHQPCDPLLATQVTTFACGGVALGVSATHKIVDASTLCTFINEWAITNREENKTGLTGPCFNSSSLFPGRGSLSLPMEPLRNDALSKYTRVKYSFSESLILNLKAKRNSSNRQWSKVQLVATIIWKALIDVDRAVHNTSIPRESILIQPVNLRGKMGSLIPKDSCGNLWGFCATESATLETTEQLTDRVSDSVKKIITDFSKADHTSDEGQTIVLNSLSCVTNIRESTHVVFITSWCKFPFYEDDFGFGKPVWVAPGTIPVNHSTYLMDDAAGNGVEAYVFLEVKDVPYFEKALNNVNVISA